MATKIINLLPLTQKQALTWEENRQLAIRVAVALGLVIFVLIVFEVNTFLFISVLATGQKNLLDQQNLRLEQLEIEELKKDIHQGNAILTKAESWLAQSGRFRELLEEISRAIPQGISLDQLNITRLGEVRLSGVAPTREDLLLAEQSLRNIKRVKDFQKPPLLLVKERNINFSFWFTIEPPWP